MYAVPDVEEVVAVAKGLGINLSSDEAVVYRKYLLDQLAALDTFVQSRIEETSPPMSSPARQPAFLPSPGEDPFNAWRWKCHIEGAPDGPLAGKSVRNGPGAMQLTVMPNGPSSSASARARPMRAAFVAE